MDSWIASAFATHRNDESPPRHCEILRSKIVAIYIFFMDTSLRLSNDGEGTDSYFADFVFLWIASIRANARISQ